ncbi:MAG: hypothetical protein HY928_06915 [Elusimicrobia bacterium]|nr:hypothetical protein [Elusimicrobiota bacterium]
MKMRMLGLALAASVLTGASSAPEAPPAAPEPPPSAAKPRPRSWRPLMARLFEKRYDRRLLHDRQRAVAVPMDDYQLFPLRTGDSVDLLAVFDTRTDKRSEKMCATVLQNIRVLGVELSAAGPGKGALILALNPNEAQMAALAMRQSELSVAARNDGDREVYPMEMAGFSKMFR